jgi:hypothetical protein
MSTMNQAVGNHAVREFFTDAEWNIMYEALAEFQDHDDSAEEVEDLMNKIHNLFKN